MRRRPRPTVPPKAMMTPARLLEEEDFERRMKSAAEAKASAAKAQKQAGKGFARISAKHPGERADHGWTPSYQIARGFRPGYGKFS